MAWLFRRRRRVHRQAVDRAGERSARSDWKLLSPLDTSVGDLQPSAASHEFARSVETSRQIESFLQPLGHDVSHHGPPGIVTALVTPVQGEVRSPDLPFVSASLPAAETRPRRPAVHREVAPSKRRHAAPSASGMHPVTTRVRPRRVRPIAGQVDASPTIASQLRSEAPERSAGPVPGIGPEATGQGTTAHAPLTDHQGAGQEADRGVSSPRPVRQHTERPLTSDPSRSVGGPEVPRADSPTRPSSRSRVGPPLASIPVHAREVTNPQPGPVFPSSEREPVSTGSEPDHAERPIVESTREPTGVAIVARRLPPVFRRPRSGASAPYTAPIVSRRRSLLQRPVQHGHTPATEAEFGSAETSSPHVPATPEPAREDPGVAPTYRPMSAFPAAEGSRVADSAAGREVTNTPAVVKGPRISERSTSPRPVAIKRQAGSLAPDAALRRPIHRQAAEAVAGQARPLTRRRPSASPSHSPDRTRSVAPGPGRSVSADATKAEPSGPSSVAVARSSGSRPPTVQSTVSSMPQKQSSIARTADPMAVTSRAGDGHGDEGAEAEELEELAAKLYPKLRHKLQAGLPRRTRACGHAHRSFLRGKRMDISRFGLGLSPALREEARQQCLAM